MKTNNYTAKIFNSNVEICLKKHKDFDQKFFESLSVHKKVQYLHKFTR